MPVLVGDQVFILAGLVVFQLKVFGEDAAGVRDCGVAHAGRLVGQLVPLALLPVRVVGVAAAHQLEQVRGSGEERVSTHGGVLAAMDITVSTKKCSCEHRNTLYCETWKPEIMFFEAECLLTRRVPNPPKSTACLVLFWRIQHWTIQSPLLHRGLHVPILFRYKE